MNRLIGFLLAAALIFSACSDSTDQPAGKPQGARLTKSQAVAIAKTAAEREGVSLMDYREPDASYGSVRPKTWQVFFDGRTAGMGHRFYVYVDDQTEETRILGAP